jgi:hypothetical protein
MRYPAPGDVFERRLFRDEVLLVPEDDHRAGVIEGGEFVRALIAAPH